MTSFLSVTGKFFVDMITYVLIAVFLENTVFSRGLGTSTALFTVRKKFNILRVGLVMTVIIMISSLAAYFLNPLLEKTQYSYFLRPAVYVAVIGIVYLITILCAANFLKKEKGKEVLSIIHVSAFNCATLGAIMIATDMADLSFGAFLGFGIGTGLGFTLATFIISIAYEQLSGENVPKAFRGFPITLIYIGIVSLAIYGLIGHELPF